MVAPVLSLGESWAELALGTLGVLTALWVILSPWYAIFFFSRTGASVGAGELHNTIHAMNSWRRGEFFLAPRANAPIHRSRHEHLES
jgi:hypothetical protein